MVTKFFYATFLIIVFATLSWIFGVQYREVYPTECQLPINGESSGLRLVSVTMNFFDGIFTSFSEPRKVDVLLSARGSGGSIETALYVPNVILTCYQRVRSKERGHISVDVFANATFLANPDDAIKLENGYRTGAQSIQPVL